ncbi:hypothetical protein ACFQZT_29320 [Paenibacillus sp. GCM10027628]|uniref:hypothetical protein n=1 Tax=Paenibacillus sp. GCM10027628 TaxID=3273413 RepID=UPI0036277F46
MDWVNECSRWYGTQIEVHIEDQAGLDPIAPPKSMILEKARLTDDQKYLQLYLNAAQFLAIPLLDETHTHFIKTGQGTVLQSWDPTAQLVYKVAFQS